MAGVTPLSTITEEREEEEEQEEYGGGLKDPRFWLRGLIIVSILFQAVYGTISYVYTLTQTTNISSYYYIATYTGMQGAILLGIIILLIVRWSVFKEYKAYITAYVCWFIFIYTIIVVWLWHYRHHNSTDSAPAPLTSPFMTYLCANVFIVFASIFFIILGWGAFSMQKESSTQAVTYQTLPESWQAARTAFLVIGILAFVFAILECIWGWMFVLDYNMGPLWVPLMFFCAFSLFSIVQFFLFLWMNWSRPSGKKKLEMLFSGHWDQLKYTELFLFMFWVINFGTWVNLWQTTGVEYTQFPKFTPAAMPVEYWNVFSNSIFNFIFAGMLPYYLVTFWCHSNDVVENANLKSLFRIGTGGFDLFSAEGIKAYVAQPGSATVEQYEFGVNRTVTVITLFIFFWLFVIYQVIAGGFILNELLQHSYLAEHFYVWYIFADVWLAVFFVVYLVYAIAVGVRGQKISAIVEVGGNPEDVATVYNSETACSFGRPLFTLLFVVFITMFTYSEIYARFHAADKDLEGTTDPLLQANSIYFGSLLGILGFLFSSVFFIAKDALMGISNSNFKYNPKFVTLEGTAVTGKHHYREVNMKKESVKGK